MPNYLLAYHGGKMADGKDAQAKVMAAWGQWMQKLGSNLIDGGNPVAKASTIDNKGAVSSGGGTNAEGGASIEVCETFNAM